MLNLSESRSVGSISMENKARWNIGGTQSGPAAWLYRKRGGFHIIREIHLEKTFDAAGRLSRTLKVILPNFKINARREWVFRAVNRRPVSKSIGTSAVFQRREVQFKEICGPTLRSPVTDP